MFEYNLSNFHAHAFSKYGPNG